jgi:hypothetical protein
LSDLNEGRALPVLMGRPNGITFNKKRSKKLFCRQFRGIHSEYSEGRLLFDNREVLVEHVELDRDPLVPAEGAFDRLAEADLGLVLVLVEIHDASAFAVDLMETARASIANQAVPDGI